MSTSAAAAVPPHAAFAARLKSARLRSGKSQEKIALEVGTSRRHWIRWENGDHLPSSEFIVRIAEATGQSAEFLTFGPPAKGRGAASRVADREGDLAMDADLLNGIRALKKLFALVDA